MRGSIQARSLSVLLACAMATSGCSMFGPSAPPAGQVGHISGFLGAVAADEPQAALVARGVLSAGGNAADAAVALGFALAVTLPSRAGLGGGGACLSWRAGAAGKDGPVAVLFTPRAPASTAGSSRPAAVPMLARGLYALHARDGSQPFETLVSPAERLARFGVPASRALVSDLAVVAGPLAADPEADRIFFRAGRPLADGAPLAQPELGATLAQIRVAGVGDLYQGVLGRRVADAARQAGGSFTIADLRAALPQVTAPLTVPAPGHDLVAFLPPPADGGLAAAAAFQALRANPADDAAATARALAAAARWRQGGITPQAILAGNVAAAGLPALPASTSFAVLDRNGNAVACALTMDNLFGTGRIAPSTGMVLAASPSAFPPPLLSAAIAYNPNVHAFRAAVASSGQEGAPLATAAGMMQALAGGAGRSQPAPGAVPGPGRANIIACSQYRPGENGSCGWATDPRGAGLAAGSN
ncbi:MAG: gamma-glutamyltransferase [Rhodospirillales bacterium]|nr:gamma-glutamyltransferase [Rhodospirillales bacterium]